MPRLDTTLGRAVPTTVMVLASIATLMIIGMIGGMWRQDSQRPCVHAVLCSTHDQRKDCESNNCAWQDALKACNELQLFLPTDDPANEEGTRMNDVHFHCRCHRCHHPNLRCRSTTKPLLRVAPRSKNPCVFATHHTSSTPSRPTRRTSVLRQYSLDLETSLHLRRDRLILAAP